jgi:tRNA-5-methyluridine54 2-sulfurtransferase
VECVFLREMQCSKCKKESAVIEVQHGSLGQNCFFSYFEEKVYHTIREFHLIEKNDRLCVAVSGGKDSTNLLYLIKRFAAHNPHLNITFFALAIDEGIRGYRGYTLRDIKKFCKQQKIELKVVSFKKEIGFTLDAIVARMKKKELERNPCTPCGVFRRYLLNRYARKYHATKLVTGHTLDDEAQAFVMNLFKATTTILPQGGPITGVRTSDKFIPRIKPLYLVSEKESRLYSHLRKFPLSFHECPYADVGFRSNVRDMLNDFESHHRGTKSSLMRSYLSMLPILKENAQKNANIGSRINNGSHINKRSMQTCDLCGEPSANTMCTACVLLKKLRDKDTV